MDVHVAIDASALACISIGLEKFLEDLIDVFVDHTFWQYFCFRIVCASSQTCMLSHVQLAP